MSTVQYIVSYSNIPQSCAVLSGGTSAIIDTRTVKDSYCAFLI